MPTRCRYLNRLCAARANRTRDEKTLTMDRQRQIDLLNRLLHYVETKTTCLADAPWRNDVSVYSDPEHLAHEQQFCSGNTRY
jgi:hypothetical protein